MRILTYLVMFYMSLALIWWTVLLTKNNHQLYEAKVSALDTDQPNYADELQVLESFHDRKARMILGEGLVFGCMLILGLYVIQRMFNKELENVQQQKNFLLSVTHELKTPIASVNLITETLQKRTLEKEQQKELLDGILDETRRLEKLINNLLFSARLQTRYQYIPETISLANVLQQQKEKFSKLFPSADIQIDCHENIFLFLDKESFHSVIGNLLENAIKYGGKPPTVAIRALVKKPFVTFEISDNGPGITKQEVGRVFDAFYRIGNEETRQTKGTGLGLYIAKKIVTAQGGTIEVEPKQVGGSIFRVTFPMPKQEFS